MYNENPSSGWASFSTFLDQALQNNQNQAQPGSLPTWQEQWKLGDPRTQYGSPGQFNQQAPQMGEFAQMEGPPQNNQVQQQVLNSAQNPAQQIFNEIGQGKRFQQRRQERQGRSFNQFKNYSTPWQQQFN